MGVMYHEEAETDSVEDVADDVIDAARRVLEAHDVTFDEFEFDGMSEDGAEIHLKTSFEGEIDLSQGKIRDHGDPTDEYDHHYVRYDYEGMTGSGRVEKITSEGEVIVAAIGRY